MNVNQHEAGNTRQAGDVRKSRRADARLEAVLASEHGKVAGLVVNLSRTGLCMESDKALADLLLASVRRAAGAAPVMVQVRLEVPAGASGTVPVSVQARTVYVIHDHANVYRCGLEFSTFAEGGEVFEAYLHEIGLAD